MKPKIAKKENIPEISLHIRDTEPSESVSSTSSADSSNPQSQKETEKIPEILLQAEVQSCRSYRPLRKSMRNKIQWEEDEFKALLEGVELYGDQNWSAILTKFGSVFKPERRAIDLCHKYNQHIKKSSFYKTSKKNWVEIKDEKPVTDAMGENVVLREKFPYDAASKFAKRRRFHGYNTFKLVIQELENQENRHAYDVTVGSDKIIVKKVVLKNDIKNQ